MKLRRKQPNLALSLSIGFSSLALGLLLIDWALGEAFYVRNTPARVRFLATTQEPFNTYFLGTSATYRHLDPVAFDAAYRQVSSDPLPPYSMNLGISDCRISELAMVTDLLLSRRDLPVRRVVLELGVSPYPQRKNDRALFSHTPWNLAYHLGIDIGLSLRFRSFPDSLRFAANAVAETVDQTTSWLTRRGLIVDWLHSRHGAKESANPELLANRGYDPYPANQLATESPQLQQFLARHPRFLVESQANYQLVVDAKTEALAEATENTDMPSQLVMISKLKRAGIRVIAFLPPRGSMALCESIRRQVPEDLLVMDFCNPIRYPALYQTQFRVDHEHLNASGSELLNQYFAEDLQRRSLRAKL